MATTLPTAARLVAAIALGLVSGAMVYLLIHFYPDENFQRDRGNLQLVFGGVGALVGWYSLGKRIATDGGTGIFLGLRAAVTVIVWLLFILAINHVIGQIVRDRFAGAEPMEAIWLMMQKAAEYSLYLLNLKFIGIIAFAGITVGVLTRNTHHKWN